MATNTSTARGPSAVWQRDEDVSACPLCEARFTWYHRKHHCRKCGRVVCHNCCSNYYPLCSASVVRPPETTTPSFLSNIPGIVEDESGAGIEEVRTCDGCFSRMEQERCRRMMGLDMNSLDPRVAAQIIRDSTSTATMLASPPPSYSRAATAIPASNHCTQSPSGRQTGRSGHGHSLAHHESHGHGTGGRSGRRQRRHAHDELGSSSMPTASGHRPNLSLPVQSPDVPPLRFVSFQLNEQDKMLGEECPICFEEYEAGASIARLECWCVFHLDCIKAWKSQKSGMGGCPLHFHD